MQGRRLSRALPGLLLAASALLAGGCGDPVVVLGDAPGYMRLVAGIPDSIGTRIDPRATRTRLTDPTAVTFAEADGILYLADRGSTYTSQGVTRRVTRIMAVSSSGQNTLLLDSGGCTQGPCLIEAAQMAMAPDGSIVIADVVGNRVLRFNRASRTLAVLAGTGLDATAPDGAAAAQSPVSRPAGVAVDAAGVVYFSDSGGNRVRRIAPDGTLQTVAGTGAAAHGGDGGPALGAALNQPAGLAVGDGRLFISELGAHTVRVVDLASGIITTVAGTLAPRFGGDGGPAAEASLASPRNLALAADGRTLFIADRDNHRIRIVNLVTGTIDTYGGTGSVRFTGIRQPAGSTSLHHPVGLWVSERGFLFIADTGHQVVWRATLIP